jgi:CheY-like chemotaxis protein
MQFRFVEVYVSSSPSTPPRILCVDDRVTSLEVRRELLKQMGYDVLVASDPESALAIMDKVEIDLVVLDYSFPGHRSGEELAHDLRARKPGLPLIMLSGYPELPDSARESVDILLTKGTNQPPDLLKAITSLLSVSPNPAAESPVDQRNRELIENSRKLVEHAKNLQTAHEKH